MYKYLILVLIAVIGIFADFHFLGSVGSSLLKIILFLAFIYLVFQLWKESNGVDEFKKDQPVNSYLKPANKEFKNPIFDIKPATLIDSIQSTDVLSHFIEDQFYIIWNFLLPHNGYIFHRNSRGEYRLLFKQIKADLQWKEPFTIPAALQLITDSNDNILIENTIEPGSNLIPFYTDQDYSLRALLGFKIHFKNSESLYFIFDAEEPNFFNSEELGVLNKVIKTIYFVVDAFLSDKGIQNQYISNDRKLALSSRLNQAAALDDAIDVFTDFIAEEFEASKLTIALKCISDSENEQAEVKKAVGLEDIYKKGYRFSLDEGLNGWVIQKNKAYIIDNIDKGEYFIPRFSKDEKSNYGIRSFLSVPLRKHKEAIGMVTLEHQATDQFNDSHREVLEEFVQIFSLAVPRLMN